MKNTGDFVNREDKGETVNKHGELDQCASGGPWLFKGNDVNGNTSGGVDDDLTIQKRKLMLIVNTV